MRVNAERGCSSWKRGGVWALAVLALAGACAPTPGLRLRSEPGLTAFRSEAELRTFLNGRRRAVPPPHPPIMESPPPVAYAPAPSPSAPSAPPPPAMAVAPAATASAPESVVVSGSRVRTAAPKITNTQEADVDEGGIVKIRGDILVVLRRGRLYTVSLAGGGMRPVDSIDAFPPGVEAYGDWYDEMLLSGDRVIVVGYSYARGGTEVNRFRIDDAGRIRFEDAHHLRSNDYYSSRNYASRLIGDELILYTPLELDWDEDPLEALPGIRRWTGDEEAAFRPIAKPRRIFIPPALLRSEEAEIEALHTVIRCDLTAPVLDCDATGVLGPESRSFYVSGRAVYLWLSEWNYEREDGPSLLYRLPLDGGRPSAVGVRGAPVDQFAFREDPAERMLNVLVRSQGGGDAMWRPEFTSGSVALLRLPLSRFGDGSLEAPQSLYRDLPPLAPRTFAMRNRFIGEHVLYGAGRGWGAPTEEGGLLVAAPVRGGQASELRLTHPVDRIEPLGGDGLVVGSDPRSLTFTAIDLTGGAPRLGDRYTLQEASEAETRSHAFFFSPDANAPDGASGTLGLPIAKAGRPAYRQLFQSSAAILFLRRDNRRFSPLGDLAAAPEGAVNDNCQASCADWYGNARPIFLGQRVFALLGYELVEGVVREGAIREVGRVDFAPRPRDRGR